MQNITRGSFANHAAEFGTGKPITPRWLAGQIVALDAMLYAAVALRKPTMVRTLARQIIRLNRMLEDSVTSYCR